MALNLTRALSSVKQDIYETEKEASILEAKARGLRIRADSLKQLLKDVEHEKRN